MRVRPARWDDVSANPTEFGGPILHPVAAARTGPSAHGPPRPCSRLAISSSLSSPYSARSLSCLPLRGSIPGDRRSPSKWRHGLSCDVDCPFEVGHSVSGGASPSGSNRLMLSTERPCAVLCMAILSSATRPTRTHIATPRSSKTMAGIELLPSSRPPGTTTGSRRQRPALNDHEHSPWVTLLNCNTRRSFSSTGNWLFTVSQRMS